jgi:tRNA A-37 threonylcarbamoyl transferase component Bud32
MLSLGRRRILKTVLKFKYIGVRRARWLLREQNLAAFADSIVDIVRGILGKDIHPDIEVLKLTRRKAVFRAKNPEYPEKTFVVKAFFLNHFSHRLNYHLYGLDEAANLIQARARGINTPDVYGYSDIRDTLGFVKTSIIILESLNDLCPIGPLMRTMKEAERTKIFMSTIPLFISLYKANCNHIDISSSAIMLSNHNANPTLSLLDFQHAKFYDKQSTEVLMFESGYFARSCRQWISNETAMEWVDRILSYICIKNPDERQKARQTFEYHLQGKGRTPTQSTLSRKQRKRIV